MRFVEVCAIILAALFLIPATIGFVNELTGVITDNLNLTSEMDLVLSAYPLFFLALPVIIIIMLFRRRGGTGGVDGEE